MDNPEGELSLLIVNDPEIELLNKKYLQRSGPTNVIAFPMREGKFIEISPQLLGDVVISIDTAYRESLQAEIGFDIRFDQLLVHGILHLLGYDHENDQREALIMEEKSAELLKLIDNVE